LFKEDVTSFVKVCGASEAERVRRTEAVIAKLNECLTELDALDYPLAAASIDGAVVRLGGEPVPLPEKKSMLNTEPLR
jgi:hypothetical protein